jgi:hypothetical protein
MLEKERFDFEKGFSTVITKLNAVVAFGSKGGWFFPPPMPHFVDRATTLSESSRRNTVARAEVIRSGKVFCIFSLEDRFAWGAILLFDGYDDAGVC